MKRFTLAAAALMLLCFVLSGCTKQEADGYIPYEELPADYTVEQATSDGCVVFTDLNVAAGQEIWDEFVAKTQNGEAAQVRLASYYALSEEATELLLLNVRDLTYDGSGYTLRYDEAGITNTSTYPYLVKYDGTAQEGAAYSAFVYYALVNDDTLTYDDLVQSMVSSLVSDHIDFTFVYTNLID